MIQLKNVSDAFLLHIRGIIVLYCLRVAASP